jgi:GTP-binding protein Era
MKTGFVSIIGRPNVGKSTLLNILLDYKLSIISEKPQTTRNNIKGIYNDADSQIVFIDTPGVHKAKKLFGEVLNEKAYKAYKDVDLIMFITPSNQKIGPGDQMIIDRLKDIKNKVAIITKCDIEKEKEILDEKAHYLKKQGFKSVISSSTKNPKCQSEIISFIKEFIEEGIPLYATDELTDKPIRFIAKEVIREAAINNLHDELPHSIAVEIEEYKKINKIRHIQATIFVEKESQKGILIGVNASKIKLIGKTARLQLQEITDEKVHLKLLVKIAKN